jgi:hypothetical protein
MAQAISRGAVVLLEGKPALSSGPRLRDCPFCSETLFGAVVSAWPWTMLRAAGQTHEPMEAL